MPDSIIKKIWLLRHAESKAQTEEEYGFDTGLSERGLKQAQRLEKVFGSLTFDKIYLSPLKRARETFEHSGITGCNIEFDSRIVEELPGNAYSSILPYPALPGYGSADSHNAWLTGARQRAICFLDELHAIKARHVLVLSHGGFFNHLLTAFLPQHGIELFENFKHCQTSNAGISVLYVGPNIKYDSLLSWNDIRHVHDLIVSDPLAPLPDDAVHGA
ncbi:MAG: histidine phosphatase family protein [Victivallales bacterium]